MNSRKSWLNKKSLKRRKEREISKLKLKKKSKENKKKLKNRDKKKSDNKKFQSCNYKPLIKDRIQTLFGLKELWMRWKNVTEKMKKK